MQKWFIGITLFCLLKAPVWAVDVALEVDQDLMQTIEDTNKSLSSNIALENAKGSAIDAQELTGLFEVVEQHFVKKGNADDAVQLSKKSRILASDIVNYVAAKNYEHASNAATELSRACKSCHAFYKKD